MRTRLLFSVLILATLFVGCSKSSDKLKKSDIVGKWNVTETWSDITSTWEPDEQGIYVEFNENDTFVLFLGAPMQGTYTMNDKVITCTIENLGSVTVTIISINGNNATLEVEMMGHKTKYKVQREIANNA